MLDNLEDKLYTDTEVIRLLRCSRVSLWRWREAGLIGYIRMGNKILYSKDNIQEFLKNSLVTAKRMA